MNAFDRAHLFTKAAQGAHSFSVGENSPLTRQRARYFHQHDILVFLMKICSTDCMQQVLTAKLKLQTTPEQFRALRTTQLAYRDALNYVSRYAFAHDKMSNKVGLQEGTYQQIRTRFGL